MSATEQQNANDLNIQDLAVMRSIIETATERGTFKAQELAAVGTLFNKLDMFLKAVEDQAKAAQESAEEAQEPADEGPGEG
jgi:hypothetical protein